YFFRPEPEDEVVVGFFNDDPRRPVILGALFGSKNAPPKAMGTPSEKNEKSGIVTKFGTTIQLLDPDENKASVSIETANKNKLLIDDGAKSIVLSDQHENSITMGESGIEIKSETGNVTISGKKVDIK
ncbi:MAG TPA: phage baseplate assembly protein V, partial [Sorangium sp.]|nr:phage baseplate assembly protein V [Sorangium sp.]